MPSKRILFTNPYCDKYYDYYRENTPASAPRPIYPRVNSYGLRFLRQNLKNIEILEYPTWDEYLDVLSEGWDVLGFSFFTPDFNKVREMVEAARSAGVPRIWGGGYGSLIPEAHDLFDEVFVGYAEQTLARKFDQQLFSVIHPPIVDVMGDTEQPYLSRVGVLFSTRGCPLTCSFCQSPAFSNGQHTISLESIERTLRYYKEIGVSFVLILDETFGLSVKHTVKVIELLRGIGLRWMPLTRVDILSRNLDAWLEFGLEGALLGVESIRQENLDLVNKKQDARRTLDLVQELLGRKKTVIGFYMIGLEHDTVDSVQEDISLLSGLGFDLLQICVLTPLHRTQLWDQTMERFGWIDPDLSRHDMKTLVWKHPHISRDRMQELLGWCFEELYPDGKLEYSRAKWFDNGLIDVGNVVRDEDIVQQAFFDGDEVIQEDRRSPSRMKKHRTRECLFCGRSEESVRGLAGGLFGFCICDQCGKAPSRWRERGRALFRGRMIVSSPRCAFCGSAGGKPSRVAGCGRWICEGCISTTGRVLKAGLAPTA